MRKSRNPPKVCCSTPNTTALRTGEKAAILENGGKGSHKKNPTWETYLGLENERYYGGAEAVNRGAESLKNMRLEL